MNPLSLIPEKVRLALYVLYGIGAAILLYTENKGWTGQAEKDLWLGLGAVFGVAAASNVAMGNRIPNATILPGYIEDGRVADDYEGEHRAPLRDPSPQQVVPVSGDLSVEAEDVDRFVEDVDGK